MYENKFRRVNGEKKERKLIKVDILRRYNACRKIGIKVKRMLRTIKSIL